MNRPRLLIADDHALLLDGLRKLLEPEFELAGTAADGHATVEAWSLLRPDLALIDVGLPLLNGIEAAGRIRRLSADARILMLSMHADRVYVEESLRLGASGYVLKQGAATELMEAIRTVLAGGMYLSPALGPMPDAKALEASPDDLFRSGLTPRQRQVLQLISEGKSMKEIAFILRISVRTVEFHKNGIIQELGLRTTAELTRYALDHGITGRGTIRVEEKKEEQASTTSETAL